MLGEAGRILQDDKSTGAGVSHKVTAKKKATSTMVEAVARECEVLPNGLGEMPSLAQVSLAAANVFQSVF